MTEGVATAHLTTRTDATQATRIDYCSSDLDRSRLSVSYREVTTNLLMTTELSMSRLTASWQKPEETRNLKLSRGGNRST